jgi:hypothetical protein
MPQRLCFVLMPFGSKPDESGRVVDFDRVYRELIKLAIEAADLDPIRADEETSGGIIHKPMYERLMLCDYAVADLPTANANVFYELGIRHGIRPYSTVLVFAQGLRLPFDVAPLRGLPYRLDRFGAPEAVAQDRDALAERLRSCRNPAEDSPLFQLVRDWPAAGHRATENRQVSRAGGLFASRQEAARRGASRRHRSGARGRKRARYRHRRPGDRRRSVPVLSGGGGLGQHDPVGRRHGADARAHHHDPRATGIRAQPDRAPRRGRNAPADRDRRAGRQQRDQRIVGRAYKDRWEDALKTGRAIEARGWLRNSIDAYVAGYTADIRDAYPGVNAVTLMEMEQPVSERQAELLPAVRLAVKNRLATNAADYWDHATLLELSVLADDRRAAEQALGDALAAVREPWEPKTTARNLRLIREVRTGRGGDVAWIAEIEAELGRAQERAAVAGGERGGQ